MCDVTSIKFPDRTAFSRVGAVRAKSPAVPSNLIFYGMQHDLSSIHKYTMGIFKFWLLYNIKRHEKTIFVNVH